jgi:hypothetical protein
MKEKSFESLCLDLNLDLINQVLNARKNLKNDLIVINLFVETLLAALSM